MAPPCCVYPLTISPPLGCAALPVKPEASCETSNTNRTPLLPTGPPGSGKRSAAGGAPIRRGRPCSTDQSLLIDVALVQFGQPLVGLFLLLKRPLCVSAL